MDDGANRHHLTSHYIDYAFWDVYHRPSQEVDNWSDYGGSSYGWHYIWLVVWNIFSHILGRIIPIDFHMFQRGGSTTNQTFMLTCVYTFMVTIHSSYRLGMTIAPSTLDQASSVMQEAEPGSPFDGISTINRCGSLTYHPWYINMEMMWNLFIVDVDDPWYKEIGNNLKIIWSRMWYDIISFSLWLPLFKYEGENNLWYLFMVCYWTSG